MSLSPTSKLFRAEQLKGSKGKEKHSVTFLREQSSSSCSGSARVGVTHLQGCGEQAEIREQLSAIWGGGTAGVLGKLRMEIWNFFLPLVITGKHKAGPGKWNLLVSTANLGRSCLFMGFLLVTVPLCRS